MKNKNILNEDTWQEDGFWTCPHCKENNENSAWMDEEECQNCDETQFFETEYIDPIEGEISVRYIPFN